MTFTSILEKRNWRLHALILLFSVIVVTIATISDKGTVPLEDSISLFILFGIQMELFIAVAVKIFRDVRPGYERREITRILLSRFVLFMVICFIVALVIVVSFAGIRSVMHGEDVADGISDFFALKFGGWIKGTVGGLLFGAAIFIFIQWQDALKREQKLREENLIFQNETLRSQINPHFLFNNLNTLSSLIVSSPGKADSFISRLAAIYRYITENSTRDKVPLAEELSFISDYFFLYRIRDEDKIFLHVDVDSTEEFSILPVSLQILVENAIKHNMATREEPLKIEVCRDGELIVVRNNLQRMASGIRSTGTGLRNLSERIRLVTGKKLIIEETNDFFTVKMPLL